MEGSRNHLDTRSLATAAYLCLTHCLMSSRGFYVQAEAKVEQSTDELPQGLKCLRKQLSPTGDQRTCLGPSASTISRDYPQHDMKALVHVQFASLHPCSNPFKLVEFICSVAVRR